MHGHWVVPGGVTAWTASPRLPLVVSLHGSDVFVAERHGFVGRIARAVFNRAARITACSEDLRQRAIALGASAEWSRTIPYGVDTSRFRPDAGARGRMRAVWTVAPDAEVVLGVGRFVRKKGFEFLIDAVARLSPSRPRLRLVLAGAGDLRGEFEQRIASHGLGDRVVLPGVLLQDEVAASLAAADVVVAPSVKDPSGNVDGLPNVVLEALASGTPIVASPAGGIGSVVRDGETGLLVREGDAGGIAQAIDALLDDRARAAAVGAAGRRWAAEHGTWGRAIDLFEAAYESACRGSNGRA
jgi:glycosyltransferase involved in cell wall biosynthesis